LKEEFPLQITYKTFYLKPDTPEEGIIREIREGHEPGTLVDGHLGDAATEAGVVMKRSPIVPNSRLSFEASEFAKDKGMFPEFHRACYKEFWEHGVNLGDTQVLRGLAKQVGLDPDELQVHLEKGTYYNQTHDQYNEALKLGIRAIPSFIIGPYLFSGAQPYEFFQEVARKAQASNPQLLQ
jgi:predicted DsbA family dithiol-disulfide isomerase